MLRTFTCIMCPRGCGLEALLEPVCASGTGSRADGSEPVYVIRQVTGNGCQKGEQYVRQEIENPMRNIATSILVDGGDLPLASVRLTAPVPRSEEHTSELQSQR